MSYSFSDFSSPLKADDHPAAAAAAAALTPTENIWLQFNAGRDRKRDELEKALRRFLDEESD